MNWIWPSTSRSCTLITPRPCQFIELTVTWLPSELTESTQATWPSGPEPCTLRGIAAIVSGRGSVETDHPAAAAAGPQSPASAYQGIHTPQAVWAWLAASHVQ